MVERYAKCPECHGMGETRDPVLLYPENICGRCDGSGFDGSADAWQVIQQRVDHTNTEAERRGEREEMERV